MLKPPDRYASHLPILQAVVGFLKPKRVLEFGAGLHSTPFFLSVSGLEQLVSVERDPEWFDRVAHEYLAQYLGKRFQLTAEAPPPTGFDLVFIDDGKAAAERAETIRWVLGQPHPPVVIHDAEVPEYATAIRETAQEPATAVVL